jgi:hypothetical protein
VKSVISEKRRKKSGHGVSKKKSVKSCEKLSIVAAYRKKTYKQASIISWRKYKMAAYGHSAKTAAAAAKR